MALLSLLRLIIPVEVEEREKEERETGIENEREIEREIKRESHQWYRPHHLSRVRSITVNYMNIKINWILSIVR
jgi:hypothetical protein